MVLEGVFLARSGQRKRQPPVSLSPLEPEEALAGLMQVKPEKEIEMPKIELIGGFLRSVDTDNEQLVLAIQVQPPEPETEDHTYSFDPSDFDNNQWLNLVGSFVNFTMVDNVAKKIR